MTYTEARDELAAALIAGGVVARPRLAGDPPFAAVLSEGMDDPGGHIIGGVVPWQFRVRLIAGAWDQDAAADTLATMRTAAVSAVRALAGWQLGRVSRDGAAELAGGLVLVADLYCSRFIEV